MGRQAIVLTRIGPGRTRPFTLSLTSSLAIQGFNAATGVLLARLLGPAGRGELAAIIVWPSVLAAVGSLGVTEAVTYETARGSSPVKSVVGSSFVIAAVQALVLALVGVFLVALIHHGDEPRIIRPSFLYLAFIPLNLLAIYAAAVLNGLRRFFAFHALRLMVIAVTAGGIIVVATNKTLTVEAAVVIYLIANALTAAATMVVLARRGVLSVTCDSATVRRLLRFGIRSHTTSLASMLNERLDQLVISVFLTPAKLGLYVIAVTMTSATTMIGQATASIVVPVLASLEDHTARIAIATRYVSWVLIGSTCMAIPMLASTPTLIRILFGEEFLGAVPVTRVLLIATIFFSVNRVIAAVLNAVGRPLDAGIAESLSLMATVAGLTLLLPRLELIGAGLTSLVAYCSTTAWMTSKAARALKVAPSALLFSMSRRHKGIRHGL
jgi:O-antigen/teichoic acid export membrane protein